MNKEKQIEEVAKDLYDYARDYDDSILGGEDHLARYLVENKGYRKASEVVGEIINDLVNFADDNEKQMLVNGHSIWFINADDVTEFIAELKKKYTEEGK